MKIVHILHELKFSGAEIMYVDAASLFKDKGCELTVIATAPQIGDYSTHFEKAGYKVIHKSYPKAWNMFDRIRYNLKLISFLKKEGYDVVHNHCCNLMWEMSIIAWLAKKRSIFTFHAIFDSNTYSYLYHVFQRWSAKKLFGCIFQSISDSVYKHELNFYYNKTQKIYNWYSEKRYYPAIEGEQKRIREELNIPLDSLVIIAVGICSDNKRHTDIIRAVQIIQKKYSDMIFLHIGKGETEEEEKELVKLLNVNKNVRFCGNLNDVRKYLIASDIYVMTSIFEGISISTIEAMACGIPAILYNVAGLRDFNKTGENSLLISEDYTELAKNVIDLYSHPEKLLTLSERAIELVNKRFNMRTNASEIFQLYTK